MCKFERGNFKPLVCIRGYAVVQLVEALRYKQEVCWIDS